MNNAGQYNQRIPCCSSENGSAEPVAINPPREQTACDFSYVPASTNNLAITSNRTRQTATQPLLKTRIYENNLSLIFLLYRFSRKQHSDYRWRGLWGL